MNKTKSDGKATKGSSNFKDDPARAAEAGRKGGQSSGADTKGDKGAKTQSAGRK